MNKDNINIYDQIDKFKDLAVALQSEGWLLDRILDVLKAYLKSRGYNVR